MRSKWLALAIVAVAVAMRVLPYAANVGMITALGMFAAVYLPSGSALAVPLVARFVSDLVLGFFGWQLMLAVYAAHLAGVALGWWIKRSAEQPSAKWLKISLAAPTASLIFFTLTNFSFLYAHYPHTWAGIVESYINGLPFLRGTLFGDIGYSLILFGAYDCAVWAISLTNSQKKSIIYKVIS